MSGLPLAAGWVLLIDEDAVQARILVALVVSVVFLSLQLAIKPLKRPEDGALMALIEISLILIYFAVMLIKACQLSKEMCSTFGFGNDAQGELSRPGLLTVTCTIRAGAPIISLHPSLCFTGVYLFFIFFGLGMLLLMVLVTLVKLFVTGYVPKILLVAEAHGVPLSSIVFNVGSRRFARPRDRQPCLLSRL